MITETTAAAKSLRYVDVVPYATPESLALLRGPRTGSVTVPPWIDTSPAPVYDLDDADDRRLLYQAVVRCGTQDDHVRFLDAEFLAQEWKDLILPARCRVLWEEQFPALASR